MNMVEINDPIPEILMNKIRAMSGCDDVRDIPGFPGYAVTISGQVWSVKPRGIKTTYDKTPRRIKTSEHKGVEIAKLSANTVQYTLSIGRILLTAFISEKPFNDAHASFKDGNPKNLDLDNLMWDTPSGTHKRGVVRNGGAFVYGEALNHSKLTADQVVEIRKKHAEGSFVKELQIEYGVSKRTITRALDKQQWKQIETDFPRRKYIRGEQVSISKLTEEKVMEIRSLLRQGYSQSSIARMFGVGVGAIHMIKNGKTWRHVQ